MEIRIYHMFTMLLLLPNDCVFLKNLTQLGVYWTTEWKMWLANLRRLYGQGVHGPPLWTESMDPLSWTGSMQPLSWTGSLYLFLSNEKWTKTEIVQKKRIKKTTTNNARLISITSKTGSMDTFFNYRKVLDCVDGHFFDNEKWTI